VPLIVPALLPLACPEVDAAFGIAAAAPIKMLACKKTATNNLLNLPLLKMFKQHAYREPELADRFLPLQDSRSRPRPTFKSKAVRAARGLCFSHSGFVDCPPASGAVRK
jgi:hypothetical protein